MKTNDNTTPTMIIRKITIRNITSFRGEQTIDFTAEPLNSAGLFAITGDTGAGKSTILDAVCLALYNRAPRFDDREQLRYISGQTPDTDINLRGSDTRNALRRGTTDGMCAVEFSTNEGVFIATWQLRIKRTGRYARPEQTLEQISPRHKTFNPQDFTNEVKRIVGLDYEQFTRTVILAQNSFANFLHARQNDKSALLEKITGTGIYARISKEVYRLNAEAQKAYEVKCSELKGLTAGRLDENDLSRLENERHLQESAAKSITEKAEYLKKQLSWYNEYDKLSDEVAKATENFNDANRKFMDMRDKRELLARYDEVASMEHPFLQMKEAEKNCYALKEETETYRSQEKEQENRFAAAQKHCDTAQNALSRAETQLEQQRPFLKRGHDLKRDIKYNENSIEERRDKIKEIEKNAANRKKELATKQEELNAATRQEELCANTLQELSVHQKMLDQSPIAIEKLKRYSATQAAVIRFISEQQRLQGELETLRQELSDLERSLSALSQKQKSLIEQRTQCKMRNLGTDGNILRKNYDEAFTLQEKLRGARKLWKDISNEYSAIEELKDLKNRIATALSYLASDISAKEKQIEHLNEIYNIRLKAYTLSQSEDIKRLRHGLKEGTPCPVCGAAHHPYHTETEQHLGELMTLVEKDFREAETQLKNNTAALNEMKQKQSADSMRLRSVEEQMTETNERLSSDIEEWREYSVLDASFADCSPNVNRTARDIVIAQLADNADRTVHSAKERLDTYNTDRNTIDALNNDIEEVVTQANELQRSRSNILHNIGQAESRLEKAVAASDDNTALGNELYSDLDKLITISNWHTLLRDNAEEFIGKIITMFNKRENCSKQIQKLQSDRIEAEHDIKHIESLIEDSDRDTKKLLDEIEVLDTSINDKKNALSSMFGNEDPDTAERRLNEAVRSARNDYDESTRILRDSKEALLDIVSRRKAAEENAAKEEKNVTTLRNDIDSWIFNFNNTHSPVQFSELERIFSATSNRNELRAAIDKAKTDRILTEERLKIVQQQLNELQTLPQRPDRVTESRRNIEASIKCAEAQREDNARTLNEINSRLQAHEESLKRLAQFEPELKALENKKNDWSKLNALIGSADGNLFRVQAQCFTLKLLVEHANVQLSNLSPRYRLKNIPDSLGLEITDRYMCDQKRPISSLSGGETFVVSLGLALGLASLSSGSLAIGSLFIDEGFGNLDDESLAMVIKALGNLQSSQGRKVGIISHTSQIRDSIHPQVQIVRQKTDGYSYIRISGN